MQATIHNQIQELRHQGYVIVPRFVAAGALATLNQTARAQLAARAAPLELEADLRYPGAPESHAAAGGDTVRRLLDAYARAPAFAEVACAPALRDWMETYFGEKVRMSRAHHNCLMTKHPRYGSETSWHRDIRYWSFEREDLVSVWLALGEEDVENGGLWLVPGSHRMVFGAERFDEHKFFRSDRDDNREILHGAMPVGLEPGDALFFHCNTLHSAGKNLTDAVKFSLVFTYHGQSNAAGPGTRSASKPEVEL
ncbi:MAG TPA: phytanoyl-CoA dioxygenase family protein [Steroidobacteraceae bacterium]|nr:phytanoyl-CoA dioxygenase family protein [Steroidobacteraceae bacterium]